MCAHHPHSLGYLCGNFCSFCHLHCWASPRRKMFFLNHAITHSPSLFDAPGHQSAYASEKCDDLGNFLVVSVTTPLQNVCMPGSHVTDCCWQHQLGWLTCIYWYNNLVVSVNTTQLIHTASITKHSTHGQPSSKYYDTWVWITDVPSVRPALH